MNINKYDYNALVEELQTTRGKDFSITQAESLISSLKNINWSAAFWIVKSMTRLPNLPNNLYGLVLDRIDQQKYEETKRLENRKSWDTQEGCLSPEEFYIGMMCLSKIAQMDNRRERFEKFATACEYAIDQKKLLSFLKSTSHLAENYLQSSFEQKKESVLAQLAFTEPNPIMEKQK
jgi:hypothetical protein